jgi:hypothetical protein
VNETRTIPVHLHGIFLNYYHRFPAVNGKYPEWLKTMYFRFAKPGAGGV